MSSASMHALDHQSDGTPLPARSDRQSQARLEQLLFAIQLMGDRHSAASVRLGHRIALSTYTEFGIQLADPAKFAQERRAYHRTARAASRLIRALSRELRG